VQSNEDVFLDKGVDLSIKLTIRGLEGETGVKMI
jgi:hypothetical protein